MEEQMKNIDDWFREELGNHREAPPPQVWADLERRLDKPLRRRVWLWWLMPVLLIGLLSGALLLDRGLERPAEEKTIGSTADDHREQASPSALQEDQNTTGEPSAPADPSQSGNDAAVPAVPAAAIAPRPADANAATSSGNQPAAARTVATGSASAAAEGTNVAPEQGTPSTGTTTPEEPTAVGPGSRNASGQEGTNTAAPRVAGTASGSRRQPRNSPLAAATNRPRKTDGNKTQEEDHTAATGPASETTGNAPHRAGTRHRRPGAVPVAAGRAGNRTRQEASSPDVASRRRDGSRTSPQPSPVQRPRDQKISRNSPEMDSAIAAFLVNGTRLKIREGVYMVSIDTVFPVPHELLLPGNAAAAGAASVPDSQKKRKPAFSYGIKAGYERGFATPTVNKAVVAPYLRMDLSRRFALSFQPALRYGALSTASLPAQSYYSNTSRSLDSFYVYDTSGTVILQYKYVARQRYDSSSIGHTLSRRLLELELPLLLHYSFGNGLSVFGGLVMNFGKMIEVKENRKEFGQQLIVNDTLYSSVPYTQEQINAIQFAHSAKPLSSYNASDFANPANNPLRLGYMFGLSYQLKEKVSIDLSVQQMLSNGNYIPNRDVRTLYRQPYFRILLGYRLGGNRK